MRPEDSFGMVLANVLDSLRSRGVQDVLIAWTDNLIGFAAAIKAVTPKTEIQNCIIHQPRNLSQYVSYKDLKATRAAAAALKYFCFYLHPPTGFIQNSGLNQQGCHLKK